MRKYLGIVAIMLGIGTAGQAQIGNLINKAKNSAQGLSKMATERVAAPEALDIGAGLKEALNKGVEEAVSSLSAEDGYLASPYKVLIPEDAQKAINKLKMVPGFRDVDKKLIAKMNAAAEIAAKEATPIFVSAIRAMTIEDAKGILFGEDDAATNYLDNNSRTQLYKTFMPIIESALQEVDATKYWNSVITKYNSLPLTKDINPDLADHVNSKALDGMFGLIKIKEQGIREDVSQRTSSLLKDVFGQVDAKK